MTEPCSCGAGTAPIITANWESNSDDRWTVPGGGGKIVRLGMLSVNFQLAAFCNAVRPDSGPDWTLRVQAQLLFPK